MARIVGTETTLELMVNCKTYPAISKKYTETVCTGGVTANGSFIRLYPIPFRFLDANEKYGRWDVIRVKVYRDSKDQRPESWHLEAGTPIEVIESITTEKQRWDWMRHTVYESAADMEAKGQTNGCVEVIPLKFYWKPDDRQWSESQMQVIRQGDLFAPKEQMPALADKVPWQFRLEYREKNTGTEEDGKVLAWSLYQGFKRRRAQMNTDEEALESLAEHVRKSIFDPDRTVFAILGTHSRFGHWMISALYHLPTKIIGKDARQQVMF